MISEVRRVLVREKDIIHRSLSSSHHTTNSLFNYIGRREGSKENEFTLNHKTIDSVLK